MGSNHKGGGINDFGVIFNIKNDGTEFTKVHDFDSINGKRPYSKFLELNGKLWGMTVEGGTENAGVIFTINLDGTGFSKLMDLNQENGKSPFANSLSLHDGKIWGALVRGGESSGGVLFNMNPDGTEFTKVYQFENAEGRSPRGSLLEHNSKLWGYASGGGAFGDGVIFTIDLDGSNYSVMHNFSEENGENPWGELTLHNDQFWGTTVNGGSEDRGTVFRINVDGTGFTKVADLGYLFGGHPFYGSLLVVESPLSYQNEALDHRQIIYPNPASNYFNLTDRYNVESIFLTNLQGKLIKEYKHYNEQSFPLEDVSNGVYLLFEGSENSQKFIGEIIVNK